jgi:hypothetical protein
MTSVAKMLLSLEALLLFAPAGAGDVTPSP